MNLTPEQTAKITDPAHPIFAVLEKLDVIEKKLLEQDPQISTHLREIHKYLAEYDELPHLLSPTQIGVLMKGLQKHTAIQLVVDEQSKGSRGKKKPTVDDLI